MSPQLEFLCNLLESARVPGNDAAVTLLRQICVAAAEKAPAADLCRLGRCLVDIGRELDRDRVERN